MRPGENNGNTRKLGYGSCLFEEAGNVPPRARQQKSLLLCRFNEFQEYVIRSGSCVSENIDLSIYLCHRLFDVSLVFVILGFWGFSNEFLIEILVKFIANCVVFVVNGFWEFVMHLMTKFSIQEMWIEWALESFA